MKTIEEVDRNFRIPAEIGKANVVFYNAQSAPFVIYGVFHEDGKFRRMPEATAGAVSSSVHYLHTDTAGGRVRFRTDSSYVAVFAKMGTVEKMSHIALTGSVGFDLYVGEGADSRYAGTFHPPFDVETEYQDVVELGAGGVRDITIHFPLYSEVRELVIGLEKTAVLEPPVPYRDLKPIVYYGSSITQGGCASRPGNAYQNIITRKTRIDHINLGFSGAAKAEEAMADYIRDLDMSLFVYDYDHNADTPEYLAATHERMFRTIRERQPELPVIFLTRPKICLTESEQRMREIIRTTYENALAAGDRNVYLITGAELMAGTEDEGTVDGVHPTDHGFRAMARVLGEAIGRILPEDPTIG